MKRTHQTMLDQEIRNPSPGSTTSDYSSSGSRNPSPGSTTSDSDSSGSADSGSADAGSRNPSPDSDSSGSADSGSADASVAATATSGIRNPSPGSTSSDSDSSGSADSGSADAGSRNPNSGTTSSDSGSSDNSYPGIRNPSSGSTTSDSDSSGVADSGSADSGDSPGNSPLLGGRQHTHKNNEEDLFCPYAGTVVDTHPGAIMERLRMPACFVSFAEESTFCGEVACILVRWRDRPERIDVALASCKLPKKAEMMLLYRLPSCKSVWIPAIVPERYLNAKFTFKVLGVMRSLIDFDHFFRDYAEDDFDSREHPKEETSYENWDVPKFPPPSAEDKKQDLTRDVLMYNALSQDLQNVGAFILDRYPNGHPFG